ncbi:AprI/Inh family metalloprotease inhibitor [Cohaesibacter celericrescens]|uniref:Alkaline proteinase inhibitor/ Outer membrane lipoprotein Omp19 domain-containing protein n=1 Tax=Cohaesibacter celericrescens TaxID=2067669 RepID=A0A2N5XPG7_9HYPH|nr:AprI/Inh family metalloprotease inhibitor [Cohaesibacter celericrescens]PLW76393.1 hypothetical protein C0081_16065 [Cohaesibacter celericrescens]
MIRYCALGCLSFLLVGCSTAGFDRFGSNSAASLPPAPTTPVESQGLSPLVLGDQSGQLSQSNQPINNAMGAEAEFNDLSQTPVNVAAPSTARALSRTDVLGAWTLASGAEQCKLNINLTNWTGGYRASTRGCVSPDLQRINAWRLDGKQVVLLAEDGTTTIARLFSTSPARFDGQADQDGRAVSFFR